MMLAGGIATGDGAITEEMAKKKLYKKLRIQRGWNLRVLLLN